MTKFDDRFDRLEGKIDGIGVKLDDHLERLSKTEESIVWLKGHVKFTLSIAIAVVGSLIVAILKGEI
jgi:archaellum component FlaC